MANESHSQIENLSFTEGSAPSFFRMDSNLYDIVFCNSALHWMPEKQQVFNGMFSSLKAGGKIAISYVDRLPPFEFNAYMLLNPENEERIRKEMFQCEIKTKIEHYCLSSGFQIIKHYNSCNHLLLNPSRVFWNGTGQLHTAYLIFRLSLKSVYRNISLHTLAKMGSLAWISEE